MASTLEFFSSLIDAFALIALAAAIGGLVFVSWILRPLMAQEMSARAASAAALAVAQRSALVFGALLLTQMVLKAWAIADGAGLETLSAFLGTGVFRTLVAGTALAIVLAAGIAVVRKQPASAMHWAVGFAAAALVMVEQGLASHAASRLEGGAELMIVTAVHKLGAFVWVGGIIHLLLLWRRGRRHTAEQTLWPQSLARFTPLGLVAMALILAPGLYLAWSYIGSWEGLLGTGYGNATVAKVALLSFALILAASNFLAGREWRRTGDGSTAFQRTPSMVEVELGVAIALLFVAASLAALPPAVDVVKERATLAEVWEMFSPKVPSLQGPQREMIAAPELNNMVTGERGMKEDLRWSRFNHNLSGVIVLVIALAALLDRTGRVGWARHWPLLFIAFSVLILLYANNEYWPVGTYDLRDGLRDPEVLQHWLAAVLVFLLGFVEWRARLGRMGASGYTYTFPILCGVGGLLLVTHSHATYELKQEFLIQSTHLSMGLLGILLGCGRWLELRMATPYGRAGGYFSIGAMGLVGIILLFYIEP